MPNRRRKPINSTEIKLRKTFSCTLLVRNKINRCQWRFLKQKEAFILHFLQLKYPFLLNSENKNSYY